MILSKKKYKETVELVNTLITSIAKLEERIEKIENNYVRAYTQAKKEEKENIYKEWFTFEDE